jgi:chemotaxis protein methyltransferase CheR
VLEEHGVAGSVIATDLSTAALHRTAAGEYSMRELRGLSSTRIARHGTRSGNSWQINDALRDRVTILRHNLVDPLPEPVRHCQIVFCRNVLIYFSAEHTRTILGRVADCLPENGYLFLGSAEAMWPLSDRFDTVRVDETFIYRPRPEHSAPNKPDRAIPQSRQVPVRHHIGPRRPARPNRASAPARVPRLAEPAPALAVVESAEQLARVGQQALDAHESAPAITAFRKWAYLSPGDAMAHLHLGLAFEAAGDQSSARRAFTAARRAVLDEDPRTAAPSIDGYAPAELLRLLDAKTQGSAR